MLVFRKQNVIFFLKSDLHIVFYCLMKWIIMNNFMCVMRFWKIICLCEMQLNLKVMMPLTFIQKCLLLYLAIQTNKSFFYYFQRVWKFEFYRFWINSKLWKHFLLQRLNYTSISNGNALNTFLTPYLCSNLSPGFFKSANSMHNFAPLSLKIWIL